MTAEKVKAYLLNCVGDGSVEFVYQPIKTEVLQEAIKALDKQIHTTQKMYKKNFTVITECNCGNILATNIDGDWLFCPYCGQRFDIGEVEE